MRFLAVLTSLLGSTASAQLSPARYLLVGASGRERVQLELTVSDTYASGRFISAPIQRQLQRLRGRVAHNGEVRLRGVGLDLRGYLPETFAGENKLFPAHSPEVNRSAWLSSPPTWRGKLHRGRF